MRIENFNFKKCLIWLLMLNILDLFSTILFLSVGISEGNPLFKKWFEANNWLLIVPFKVVIPFVVCICWYKTYSIISSKKMKQIYLSLVIFAILVYSITIIEIFGFIFLS